MDVAALQAQVAELQRQLAAMQTDRPRFKLKAMSDFTGSANGWDSREWWCFLQH